MFSLFDRIKSIFLFSNNNKRKSTESVEILRKNISNQNDKENKSAEISVYNHIFKSDADSDIKLINRSVDKSATFKPKRRKLESPLINERIKADSIIETLDIKLQSKPSIIERETNNNSKNKVSETISKRPKSTKCELSRYNVTSKSHLLDRNLIESLMKPSIYADSRQNQLKILQAESDVNCEQVYNLERKHIEDITERFREIWATDPTVLPRLVKKPSLPDVTDEMRSLIASKWVNKRKDCVVVEEFSLSVTVTDLYSLQSKQWLTDNVINFYLELINHRNNSNSKHPKIQILTSFFYPKLVSAGYSGVKRWTKRRPIFDSQLVLVPIHLGNHWCLVTIDLDNQEVFYYDSLKSPNPRVLLEMKNFLIEDAKDKLNKQLDTDDWTFKQKYDGPSQHNSYDCGVFLCQTAEYTARRAKLDFKQEHMEYFREKMSFEIIVSKLL